jgi:hypothetical protein
MFVVGGTALWFFVAGRGHSTSDGRATDAPTSASVSRAEAPPTRSVGIATSGAAPAPASFFLCPDGVLTHCDAKAHAWCDEADHAIGCCAPGLVPVGLQRCACAPGGSKDADAVLAGCKAAGKYEPEQIQQTVRKNFGAIRECFERGLDKNPKLRGNLSIRFEIGPRGTPGHIGFTNASAPDPDFQDCVLREFAKLRFDPPPDGSVPIVYPLSFTDG